MEKIETIIQQQKSYFNTQATKSVEFRIAMLKKLKQNIHLLEKEICNALYCDLHKSNFESYIAEIALVLIEIKTHIRHLKKWSKTKVLPTPLILFPSTSKIQYEPYGIVLIISPWNYPFQLSILPLVGAIAAGNCIVLKTSPYSSATSQIIKQLITKTFNSEYISYLEDDINFETIISQKTDYIFFTGSPQTGKTVMRLAAENLIPVTLELGGKTPCIVDEDTTISIASKRIAYGKFSNAGQICVSPDYIFVHENIKEKFLTQLKLEIKKLYGNIPMQSHDYCHIIHEKHFARLVKFIKTNTILWGGEYDESKKYIAPTLIENKEPYGGLLMKEEIFGPLLPIITFTNLQEVIDYLHTQEKPLALYYFSNDKNKIQKILGETSSGGVCINDTLIHVANHYLPFGGVGNSGMGKYHGKYSFETFSHAKAIMQSPTWIDIPLKYPPYKNKLKWLKILFR